MSSIVNSFQKLPAGKTSSEVIELEGNGLGKLNQLPEDLYSGPICLDNFQVGFS